MESTLVSSGGHMLAGAGDPGTKIFRKVYVRFWGVISGVRRAAACSAVGSHKISAEIDRMVKYGIRICAYK